MSHLRFPSRFASEGTALAQIGNYIPVSSNFITFAARFITAEDMEYKWLLAACLCAVITFGGQAQKKDFSYKFYGQVRGDLFYNSRANAETVDGLFYLYPKDHAYDADGKDLNASPNGSFYVLYSRLGMDVSGPRMGGARTTLKLEADFRGSGSNWAVLRLRQAYVQFDWGKSLLLAGQTWHPLFGEVSPQILNLCTGAPFQPFSRAPQIRYRFRQHHLQLTAAAVWQLQYLSTGPNGKSEEYIKNSCVPELFGGIDYKTTDWMAGVGAELLSLVPRTQVTTGEKTFKVDERITTATVEAHVKLERDGWSVKAKAMLSANLSQTSTLGGYGVRAIDPRTGEQQYTAYRFSSSWINLVYGKRWKPDLFIGYLKNLGAKDPIVGKSYGVGIDVDQLLTAHAGLSYNLPHWRLGIEYSPATAWYGTADLADGGKIHDTHTVTNHRVLGTLLYLF